MSEQDTIAMPNVDLPIDRESFMSAPKVYSQYVTCSVTGMDVSMIFCLKARVATEGGKPEDVAFPQVVCYMSVPQFRAFVALVNRQLEAQKEAMAVAVEEAMKSQDVSTD